MLPKKGEEDESAVTSSVPESYREDIKFLQDLAEEYDNFTGTIKNGELFSLLNEIPDPSTSGSSLEESVSILNPSGELTEGNSDLPEVAQGQSSQDHQNILGRAKSSLSRLKDRASPSRFKSDKHLYHGSKNIRERSNRLHGFHLLWKAENYDISNSVLSGKHTGRDSDSGNIRETLIAGKNPFWKASDVQVEDSIIVTGSPNRLNANISNSVVVTPNEALYVESYNPSSSNWDEAGASILRQNDDSNVELPSSQNDRYPELKDSVNRALEMELDVQFSPNMFFAEDMTEFESRLESHYKQAGLEVPEEFDTERCVYSNVLEESIIHPRIGEMWDSNDLEKLRSFEYALHESVEQLVDQVRGDNYLFPDSIIGDKSKMQKWKEDVIDPMTEYVLATTGQRLATEYNESIGVPDSAAESYFENRQLVNSLESMELYDDDFKFAGQDKASKADYFLDKVGSVEGWRKITQSYLS